jgi:transketolase
LIALPGRPVAMDGMGDGEQDEGQVWEAATHAASMKLNNLISIVDANGYQLDDATEEIKPKHYLPEVWRAIGWNVVHCDGHDIISISYALENGINSRKPTVIFAKTIRGKGLPLIENSKKKIMNNKTAYGKIEYMNSETNPVLAAKKAKTMAIMRFTALFLKIPATCKDP